ncbi:SHOCT domain-containing protein [Arthrobacter sp. OVS8]|uniref:SHOCT domain-containing protein n=1 Tax=Arthrobacter sp. U41 TaxID=1849032 RepID=UPI0011A65738|nr:SHOCT domain-containing protein [Arthrobacter sp. U41]WCI09296.1 SHOCT domain-containing protein [Arthrobacter sp. OVS8]
MDSISTDFWDVLLWSFWFFIWIAALMVWFRCLFDLFGDSTLSGWGKAGWSILLIFVPWLGALIYLIARGRSMTERQMKAIAEQQAAQQEYIQQVAGKSASPASQIADAKALLDSGAITQTEFDSLKAKAMA